jgi:uncharacterized protein (DUF58 family)
MTPSSWITIPMLLGLLLLAAFLRIDTYFSLVYLLAVATLLGRLWSRQSMRWLRTERRLVNRAFPGETLEVELRVRNSGWLPVPWVEMHDSLPVDMATPPYYRQVLTMLPHQERRFTYTLSASKRGVYPIGPMIWRTGDLLGFTPQRMGRHAPETIIVYPRVLPLEALGLPTRSPLASLPAPAPLFEDPSTIIGVRPYQIGDSPRRIHWTASAAADQLLVKRYRPAIARDTLICLDLDQESYSFQRLYTASELAITIAASLANHIIVREGLAVGLATQALAGLPAHDPREDRILSMSLPVKRGRGHLMSLLEILARAQTYQRPAPAGLPALDTAPGEDGESAPLPTATFLRTQSVSLSWGTTVLLITGRETDEILSALLHLRQQGFAVALILVMPAPPEAGLGLAAEGRERSPGGAFPIYRVWREEDLQRL